MLSKRSKNSDNVIKNIDGSVHVGDIHNKFPTLDETGFRKKVLASLRNKDSISSYIDELAKFLNSKTEETTIGLERKLTEAGYTAFLDRAMDTKETFVKSLSKNQYSISYQKIIYAAIDEAISTFTYSIRPLINAGNSPSQVMSAVTSLIFERLYHDLADVAEYEFNKCILEGLVFFLTGNCFLRWAQDANIQ